MIVTGAAGGSWFVSRLMVGLGCRTRFLPGITAPAVTGLVGIGGRAPHPWAHVTEAGIGTERQRYKVNKERKQQSARNQGFHVAGGEHLGTLPQAPIEDAFPRARHHLASYSGSKLDQLNQSD